jgi:hypothetical protein
MIFLKKNEEKNLYQNCESRFFFYIFQELDCNIRNSLLKKRSKTIYIIKLARICL